MRRHCYHYCAAAELSCLSALSGIEQRSPTLRHRFSLQEEAEIISAAGFAVGTAHVESAERLYIHLRAGALPVQIEIAYMEFVARVLKVRAIVGVERSSQAELRAVRDVKSLFEGSGAN